MKLSNENTFTIHPNNKNKTTVTIRHHLCYFPPCTKIFTMVFVEAVGLWQFSFFSSFCWAAFLSILDTAHITLVMRIKHFLPLMCAFDFAFLHRSSQALERRYGWGDESPRESRPGYKKEPTMGQREINKQRQTLEGFSHGLVLRSQVPLSNAWGATGSGQRRWLHHGCCCCLQMPSALNNSQGGQTHQSGPPWGPWTTSLLSSLPIVLQYTSPVFWFSWLLD